MSNFIKKLFGTLAEKPWEKEQAAIDTYHTGKTFNLSKQTSAVIVIFGVSTVLFSLILTGYLYTVLPEQDTKFVFNLNIAPDLNDKRKELSIYSKAINISSSFDKMRSLVKIKSPVVKSKLYNLLSL